MVKVRDKRKRPFSWPLRIGLAVAAALLPLQTGAEAWWIGSIFAAVAVLIATHGRGRLLH